VYADDHKGTHGVAGDYEGSPCVQILEPHKNSMADWIPPENSRGVVKNAGETLRNSKDPFKELGAMAILNNWKASHELPLNAIMRTVSKYVNEISLPNNTVQRRKRTESILLKLEKQAKLDLARMQDLVGFRVVFRHSDHRRNIEAVEKLTEMIDRGNIKSEVANIRNYIHEPRETGYRSVHVIFKYKSEKHSKHNNMRVELQIRTRMQHIWATAVETVDMIESSILKQGYGSRDWLNFFRIMSSLMSIDEGTLVLSPQEKGQLHHDLKVVSGKINASFTLKIATALNAHLRKAYQEIIEQKKLQKKKARAGYVLIKLDLEPYFNNEKIKPNFEFLIFSDDEQNKATEMYGDWEEDTHGNEFCYVLLGKGETLDGFQKGFPNYFADIREFIDLHNGYVNT
jgi:putative GTP pyrophosphokinase